MRMLLGLFFVVLLPISAFAFDYTVRPDISWQLSGANQTDLMDGDNIQMQVLENRAYCCALNPAPGRTMFPDTIEFDPITAVGGGGVTRQTDRTTSQPTVAARTCFYNDDRITADLPVRLLIGAGGVFGGTQDTATLCSDTTLYGGFNTSVSDFNFLELRSLLTDSEAQIRGRLIITDTVGGATREVDFTVSSGGRTDVDIHSIVGAGAFGTITVLHDGPPGSLVAVLYQYRVRSVEPLDFEAVALEKYTTRLHGLK